MEKDLSRFDTLVNIIARLRGPDGCPWDREQTHASLREALLEECYEVLETLDEGDMRRLREELGDLLMQIVFHRTGKQFYKIHSAEYFFKCKIKKTGTILKSLDRMNDCNHI